MSKKDLVVVGLLSVVAVSAVFMSYTLHQMRRVLNIHDGVVASELYREIDALKENQKALLKIAA